MLLENLTSKELALEEITSADRAEALKTEWSALWERCPDSTTFQTPEWQLAWWSAFAAGKELWLLALREPQSQRLVALLPACVLRDEHKVMFVGAAVSDELDVLAEPAFAESAAQIFLNHILEERHRWNVCEFEPLPGAFPTARRNTRPRHFNFHRLEQAAAANCGAIFDGMVG